MGDAGKRRFTDMIRDELKFLDFAPILFVSALNREGLRRIMLTLKRVFEAASKRIGTGELNRFVAELKFESDIKIYYITQASVRPPTFIIFTDKAEKMHFSLERFLMNRLRESFGFEGTPLVVRPKRR